MRFLRSYQYLLCFIGVFILAGVMVIRQYRANESAHVELRENFIVLHGQGKTAACDEIYQQLIQNLGSLDERSLLDDLQRTTLLVDPKAKDVDNHIWKYHISVKKEVQQRAERRVAAVLRTTDTQ